MRAAPFRRVGKRDGRSSLHGVLLSERADAEKNTRAPGSGRPARADERQMQEKRTGKTAVRLPLFCFVFFDWRLRLGLDGRAGGVYTDVATGVMYFLIYRREAVRGGMKHDLFIGY